MIHSGCCFLFHQTFNHATLMFLRRPLAFYCPRREVPGLHIKGLHNLTQACFSASLLCCPGVPDYLLAAKYRLCVLCAEHWSNRQHLPLKAFPWQEEPLSPASGILSESSATKIFCSQSSGYKNLWLPESSAPGILYYSNLLLPASSALNVGLSWPRHPLRAVYMALVV